MSDPYFDYVALLLHCDGADGSTTFTDTSPYGHAVTAVGNAQIRTAQSAFGGASGYFDGEGDYLSLASASSLVIGTQDFTIECWINPAELSYRFLLGGPVNGGGYLMMAINPISAGNLWLGLSGVAWPLQFSGHSILANVWTHIAITRQSGINRLFVNGTQIGSAISNSQNWVNNPSGIWIGQQQDGSPWNGYIDDLRITIGVARYTANFTPPDAPFPDTGPQVTAEARAVWLKTSVLSPALTPRTAAPTAGHVSLRGWAPAEARAVWLKSSVLSPSAITFTVAPAKGPLRWTGHAPGVRSIRPGGPAIERCIIPAGRLYFDQGAGERYLGETPGAELSIDIRSVEVYGSDAPVSELLEETPFGVSRELAFKCLSPSDEVVSAFFGADMGRITQTAGTVTAERLAAVAPGRWYSLGRTAANPTGVRLVSAVTVTDDADPTPTVFVAGRDYTVDPTLGRLYVVPGGTITDGTNLRVDYTRAAATRTRHQGATWLLPRLGGALRFVAHHTSGPNRDIYVPRVVLRADGAVRLKRAYQDGQVLELGFKARFQRLETLAALYIDGRAVA